MNNLLIKADDFVTTSKKADFLFKNIWKERTTSLLHAPIKTDKTSFALDIAAKLSSRGHKTVYVDTQNRLADRCEQLSSIENMFVLQPGYESADDPTDYADLVISAIEEAISASGIRTFIVDSVTRIAALSFGRNASPAYFMKRLVALQVRHGLSLLVIAHDSTKAANRALTSLADSEINLEDTESTQPGHNTATVDTKPVEIPTISLSEQRSDDCRPPLTRQQRRALERRIAKGKRPVIS